MTDETKHRTWGRAAIDLLEERSDAAMMGWTTEELGEFWLGVTEAATLRLVRLKPEMVRRASEDES